ncbi:MAG: ParB/RepB/Spo0J family partition protein [Candidatus Moranbacteria bacterium]|nr:ParB/RepB/Spo0J family partition protein [Candidatus Moranbacteria bacterium]
MSENNGTIETEMKEKTKRFLIVPVSSIRRFRDQPRQNFDPASLRALAKNIQAEGLQTPITVLIVEDDPEFSYEIKDGERRWRAHKIAGIENIAVIVDYETKPGTQHLKSLIANFHREGHTIMDTSNALAKEKNAGVSVEVLMSACGKSNAWVYQHLSLQNLHPDLKALLSEKSSDKKLRFMPAYELSKLPKNKQLKAYEQMKKVSGATEKIDLLKSISGVSIVPRAKRPDREAANLQRFANKVISVVERLEDRKESDFKMMLRMFNSQEINDLVDKLQTGSKSLAELADILKNHQ